MEFNDDLSVVLQNIPKVEAKQDTFFDILGLQTRETYISKVYNYFLNSENKEIADLFLNSLSEIIKAETGKDFFFDDYFSELEVSTENGRIDILITSNEKERRKIIIENKIFTPLNNNLEDYWKSTEAGEKIGIVLTLYPYEIDVKFKGMYINITHDKWLKKIVKNGFPIGLSSNQYIYLNDFIINMNEIIKHQEFSPAVEFFFNKSEAVLKVIETYDASKRFIEKQIEKAANAIGWKNDGQANYYRRIWNGKTPEIYYTIIYDKLLDGNKTINIIIEFYKLETIDLTNKFDFILRNQNQDWLKFPYKHKERRGGNVWLHYLSRDYILDIKQIKELDNFILQKIQTDFEHIMELILNHFEELTPKP